MSTALSALSLGSFIGHISWCLLTLLIGFKNTLCLEALPLCATTLEPGTLQRANSCRVYLGSIYKGRNCLESNRDTLLKYQTLVFEQIAYYIMLDGGEEVKAWITEKTNQQHLLLPPDILSNMHLSREIF